MLICFITNSLACLRILTLLLFAEKSKDAMKEIKVNCTCFISEDADILNRRSVTWKSFEMYFISSFYKIGVSV